MLKELKYLQSLDLSGNPIASLGNLKELKGIKSLKLASMRDPALFKDDLLYPLRELPWLEYLDLEGKIDLVGKWIYLHIDINDNSY